MYRVIQPAGFSLGPLVQIGLISEVDEVILLSSPESLSESEFLRVKETAKKLGSKADYFHRIVPVVGEDAKPVEIMSSLNEIKETLPPKLTLVSTNGSTLKFGACLMTTFKECQRITMDWPSRTYFVSNGDSYDYDPLPAEVEWNLLGLEHRTRNNKHLILNNGRVIAEPQNVELRNGKVYLEWENFGKNARQRALDISTEMGNLCRINSINKYQFKVPLKKFSFYDRYPIHTERPVQPNRNFVPIENEFFMNYNPPPFPYGSNDKFGKCLHTVVNRNDITPTALSILSHDPDHVYLWLLNSSDDVRERRILNGKVALLVKYLSGELKDDLSHIQEVAKNQYIVENPLPNKKTVFHLIECKNISDVISAEFYESPFEETIFESNSGFLGLQQQIIANLDSKSITFQRWYTDLTENQSVRIDSFDSAPIPIPRDPSNIFLRKRIPISGNEISINEKLRPMFEAILEIAQEHQQKDKNKIFPKSGTFTTKSGQNVVVRSKPKIDPYFFEFSVNSNESCKTFGYYKDGRKNDQHFAGNWLEDLSGHIIHQHWKSHYSMIGMKTYPIQGDGLKGSLDEVDLYHITDHGIVVGECKDIDATTPANLKVVVGQLMGEVAVIGHRRGVVPMIVISKDSWELDSFAYENNIVICSWWELIYPERIIHRLNTGKRTNEEIEEREAKREADILSKENNETDTKIALNGESNPNEKVNTDTTQDSKSIHLLFRGEISLEQIHAYPGSEFACTISGIAELEGEVISISRTRFKKFFYPNFINPNAVGYRITVSRKKPKSLSKSKNLVNESKAYMDELKDITRIGRE